MRPACNQQGRSLCAGCDRLMLGFKDSACGCGQPCHPNPPDVASAKCIELVHMTSVSRAHVWHAPALGRSVLLRSAISRVVAWAQGHVAARLLGRLAAPGPCAARPPVHPA